MIVIYNRENRHVIPRASGVDQVMLVPGSQEIPTHFWFEARGYIADMIEEGIIEEEWAKKSSSEKDIDPKYSIVDPDDAKIILVPATLKDRNKNEARKIVSKCSDMATLQKWNNEEVRPEVSLEILNQMKKNDKNTSRDYKAMEQATLDNYRQKR